MPRPKPKFICNACDTIFNRKPGVEQQTCWNCGSTDTQSVAKKGDPVPKPPVVPTGTPPVVQTPPVIPAPPPAPAFKAFKMPSGGGGGGGITPQSLLAQKAKLKKVVRVAKALPGGAVSAIPRGIRVIANEVRATLVMNARVGILSNMREFPGYYHRSPWNVELATELGLIARGAVNPAHGNFNTVYRNRGLDLPTGLRYRGPRHPLSGTPHAYFEYGWTRILPAISTWHAEGPRDVFTAVPARCQAALQGYLRARSWTVNVDRLIVAETGEVFYSPDHYLTFFRYSPRHLAWYPYVSDEKFSGRGATWDESFFDGPSV